MTTSTLQTLAHPERYAAEVALQRLLAELVALTLVARQVHWNVVGPGFLALHALTDEIDEDTRAWADRVAERTVALGFSVDTRSRRTSAIASAFPTGRIADHEAAAELSAVIDGVASTGRHAIDDLEGADIVAHALTVEVVHGLDKYRWMLQASSRR